MDELWPKNVENRDFTVVVPIFQNSDRNLFWNWPDSRLPKKELGRSNNSSVPRYGQKEQIPGIVVFGTPQKLKSKTHKIIDLSNIIIDDVNSIIP